MDTLAAVTVGGAIATIPAITAAWITSNAQRFVATHQTDAARLERRAERYADFLAKAPQFDVTLGVLANAEARIASEAGDFELTEEDERQVEWDTNFQHLIALLRLEGGTKRVRDAAQTLLASYYEMTDLVAD